MNKKILLITSTLLTLVLISIIIFNNTNNSKNSIVSNINKNEQVIKSNMITMMYETEAGSGEYTETTDNTWPESGYIFNDTLSGCENGGELEYNSENNTVNLLSHSSDQCYVYFDKYDGVWIDNVVATNVTGSSITLDVSATSENGSITTYYYSLNDSEEYIETTTNPIIIDDLNKLTEYKISIYAVDSTNAKSNIYELNITTTNISVPVINSVEVSNITDSGFTLTVDATSDVEISKYYFIIDSEDMAGISSNNSYNFDNLKIGSSYNVIVYVKDINDKLSNEYIINVTTNDTPTTIEDICSDSSKSSLLVCHILSQYNDIQGNNGIYYHNSSLINGAGDNSYRYAGASDEVNNYVCFGSTASTCPSDNLYRIIGVFGNQVKLIKADYTTTTMTGSGGDYYGAYSYSTSYYKGSMSRSNIAGYLGNSSGSNIWSTSALNATNLNGTYLNSLGSTWGNKIATTGWKVGGMTWTNGGTSNARTTYNYEVGSSSSSTTYSAKIGLMYVSDYGFAASPSAWTTNLSSYSSSSIRDNNWMYMGLHEWTISRRSDTMDDLFYLFDSGTITYGTMDDYSFPVRPCFYLNSDVQYVSGSGTESDPIRIQ